MRDNELTSTLDVPSERPAGFQLLVFGDGWSQIHSLGREPGEHTIGREDDCAIQIDDKSVSRRHAILSIGATLSLRDLGSSNGIEVDGTRVPANESVPLRPGARVRLGAVSLVVYGETKVEESEDELDPNDPMREVHRLCDQVAASDLSVLLLGETGTGKELLAERIHLRSARAQRAFVRVNAATLPEALAESQLFGHERGAFTGANQPKDGLISAANGGTLLLDEVGELPPPVQNKLLRVVETGAMFRVGATTEIHSDVRWVAATSRDVEELVASGTLRSDLVYRLAGVTVYVPPLRERPMAILPLAKKLLAVSSGGRAQLSSAAARAVAGHSWFGNVRELKATMHRAAVLSGFGQVEPEHLALGALRLEVRRPMPEPPTPSSRMPPTLPPPPPVPSPADASLREDVEAMEKERILAALSTAGGNQTRAAEMLGISRRTLGTKLDKWNLVRPRKPR